MRPISPNRLLCKFTAPFILGLLLINCGGGSSSNAPPDSSPTPTATPTPSITPTPVVTATPTSAPTPDPSAEGQRVEAESGTLTNVNIATTTAGFSGTGYISGFDGADVNGVDDQVAVTFSILAGYYRISVAYRTLSGDKAFNAAVDDLVLSNTFPDADAFSQFELGVFWLDSGDHTITIGGGWNFYEIDYVDLEVATAPSPPQSFSPDPADENLTVSARNLLDTLAENYGQFTLSGQQEYKDAGNFVEIEYIRQQTGKRPAIIALDLIEYSPSRIAHGSNPDSLVEEAIQIVQTEGLVLSLSWHWNAPMHLLDSDEQPWYSGFYTEASTFNLATTLADTESEEYLTMLTDIDAIAVQLQKLADTDIPILWRPLHESEGGWFWWGAVGPDAFKELWQLLFDRLTNHHGIHNLIWVLTSEDPEWYPGDNFVDIVGVDAYPENRRDPLLARWQAMRDLYDGKKLIALTEFGGVPDIIRMQQMGVWFSYFASWTDQYDSNLGPMAVDVDYLNQIYSANNVITLDEWDSLSID